jgi:signal peptidase I
MSTRAHHLTEGLTLITNTFRKILENEYVKTAMMIILIIAIVFGFWYGLQLALNTQYPVLVVATGSMCKLPGPYCDGWSHPFERTLHVGDLIIVQGVAPEEIVVGPDPYGDIIVFCQDYAGGERIVHRAIAKEDRNGTWYFQTKGDGNTSPDSHYPNISEDDVIGKVILRIPWVGHIALIMHNSSGLFIIIILIVILVILEFMIPAFSSKKPKDKQGEDVEKTFET